MTQKPFASQADLQDQGISFMELGEKAYADTAEGDPNAEVLVGDDAAMAVATPASK